MKRYSVYMPGITLIVAAVTILIFPALIRIIVASMMMTAGISFLFIGYKMRRHVIATRHYVQTIFDHPFFSGSRSHVSGKEDVFYH